MGSRKPDADSQAEARKALHDDDARRLLSGAPEAGRRVDRRGHPIRGHPPRRTGAHGARAVARRRRELVRRSSHRNRRPGPPEPVLRQPVGRDSAARVRPRRLHERSVRQRQGVRSRIRHPISRLRRDLELPERRRPRPCPDRRPAVLSVRQDDRAPGRRHPHAHARGIEDGAPAFRFAGPEVEGRRAHLG